MKRGFLTSTKPLNFIKHALIPALSFLSFGAIASEYRYSIELDEPYPYIFEDGIDKAIDVNLNQMFTTVESVCLEGTAESGIPSFMLLSEISEPLENGLSYDLTRAQAFGYQISIGVPGEPAPAFPHLETFDECFSIPSNLTDGIATFNLTFRGDDLDVTSLNLIINGVLDNTQILSELSTDGVIPADGGALAFSTQITNTDIDFSEKHFRTWSHVTFPNGDTYPVKGPRRLNLQYQETKTMDTRFFVPDWFSAGEYTLTVYAADTLNGDRVTSSFNFTKIAEEETITQ